MLTTGFISAYLRNLLSVDTNKYPPPTGYKAYLTLSGNIVDSTTSVVLSNYTDEIVPTTGNYCNAYSEQTSVELTVIYYSNSSVTFDGILLATTVGGNDLLQVAKFSLKNAVTKPADQVLLIRVTLTLQTPMDYFVAPSDMYCVCNQYCSAQNLTSTCQQAASNVFVNYFPASVFNVVFTYFLVQDLSKYVNSDQVKSANSSLDGCLSTCGTKVSCAQYCYIQNVKYPILQLLSAAGSTKPLSIVPTGVQSVYYVTSCYGVLKGNNGSMLYAKWSDVNPKVNIDVSSPSVGTLTIDFTMPGIGIDYDSVQFVVGSASGFNFTLGINYFLGITLPNGTPLRMVASIVQVQ